MSGFLQKHKTQALIFAGSFVIGLLTHAYMLSHKLPNWDDINNFDTPGVSSLYGRWFLDVLHPLGGRFSVPWANGLITLFLLSLCVLLICRILEIRSLAAGLCAGAVFMTFPSLASTFCFMFTIDLYAAGLLILLLGTLALRELPPFFHPGKTAEPDRPAGSRPRRLAEKLHFAMPAASSGKRRGFPGAWGFPISVLCFILTLGTYQSYICFGIALLVFGLILDLLKGKPLKEVFLLGVASIASLLLSILIYLPLSYAIHPEMRTEGQNGLEHLGSNLNPLILLKQFFRTYKRIAEYFVTRPMSFVTPWMHALQITAVIAFFLLLLLALRRRGLLKKPAVVLSALFLVMLLPPSLAFFYVMSPEANVSTLMYYQYCLPFIFLLPLARLSLRLPGAGHLPFLRKLHTGIPVGLLLILIAFSDFVLVNQAYLRMELAKEHALAYYNRILYALEHTPGFRYGDQAAILGNIWEQENPSPIASFSMDDQLYRDFSGIATEYGLLTTGVRRGFIHTYLGVDLKTPPHFDLEDNAEYRAMPVYPEEGCIKKIGDIWVVKISAR